MNDTDTINTVMQALTEAFGSGNLVLAIVAAVLVAGLVVLRFLGKKVPLVDLVVKIVIGVARTVGTKKQPPVPGVEVAVTVEKDGGLGNVIQIKKDQ